MRIIQPICAFQGFDSIFVAFNEIPVPNGASTRGLGVRQPHYFGKCSANLQIFHNIQIMARKMQEVVLCW